MMYNEQEQEQGQGKRGMLGGIFLVQKDDTKDKHLLDKSTENGMSLRQHAVITTLVFGLMMTFIFLGGCTQVVHSDQPNFEYPVR